MLSRQRPRGFTLMEVLLAIALLAIMLGGTVELFSNTMLQSQRNAEKMQRDFVARQQLAVMRGAGYEALRAHLDKGQKDQGYVYFPDALSSVDDSGYFAIARLKEVGTNSIEVAIAVTQQPGAKLSDAFEDSDTVVVVGQVQGGRP